MLSMRFSKARILGVFATTHTRSLISRYLLDCAGAFGKLRDEMEEFFPPMLEVLETLRELLGAPEGKKGKGAPGAKRGCGPVPCVLL